MSFTTSPRPVVFTAQRNTYMLCFGVNYAGVKQVTSWKELAPGDFCVQFLSSRSWWSAGQGFTAYDASQITITRVMGLPHRLEDRIILMPTPGEKVLTLGTAQCVETFLNRYAIQTRLWDALGIDCYNIRSQDQKQLLIEAVPEAPHSLQLKLSNVVATTEPVVIHLESSTPSNPVTRFIERLRQLFTRQKL